MEQPSQAQAWLFTLATTLILVSALAQPTDPGNAVTKGVLNADPEEAWDVFSRTGAIQSVFYWSPSDNNNNLGGDAAKLFDNVRDSPSFVKLALPAGPSTAPVRWLTINLNKNNLPTDILGIQDLSMRFRSADSDPSSIDFNYTACISKGEWRDDAGRIYFTLPNLPGPPDPKTGRIAWLLTRNQLAAAYPSSLSLWLPGKCVGTAGVVAVAEIDGYTRTTLRRITNNPADADHLTGVYLADDHFHPCSFNLTCESMVFVKEEQEKYGVGSSMVYGLQHQMLVGANPWLKAMGRWFRDIYKELVKKAPSKNDPLPFHYNDFAARPGKGALAISGDPKSIPGIAMVNKVRKANGYSEIDDYIGWPMTPTLQADWITLCDYYKNRGAGLRGHIYPYFSSLRIEGFSGKDQNRLFDVCSRYGSSGPYINTMLVRAMDTLFPESVFGYQEYNLNKTAVLQNIVYEVVDTPAWYKCMDEVFRYLEATRKPFGFHDDYIPGQLKKNGIILTRIAKKYRKNIIVWDHGGIAPEVSPYLTAVEHIAALEDFLKSGEPGTRYVDLSWDAGFWIRLRPSAIMTGWPQLLPDKEFANGGDNPEDIQDRSWFEDALAYLEFIEKWQDNLMYGSDQVALNYGSNIQVDVEGNSFVNRNPSTQRTMYSQVIRVEVGTLLAAFKATNKYLPASVLKKVFWENARRLQTGVRHAVAGRPVRGGWGRYGSRGYQQPGKGGITYTGLTRSESKQFIRWLLVLQYKENLKWAKEDAPSFREFAPKVCKMGW